MEIPSRFRPLAVGNGPKYALNKNLLPRTFSFLSWATIKQKGLRTNTFQILLRQDTTGGTGYGTFPDPRAYMAYWQDVPNRDFYIFGGTQGTNGALYE